MIKYIGKTLLIEDNGERVLVIGDLHLGYEEVMRRSGILVPSGIYEEIVNDLNIVFDEIGKIDKIILLGDLKHEFGKILKSEWKEVFDFLDFLCKRTINYNCEIIILKGNHDVMTGNLVKKKGIKIVDYYLWGEFVFMHGDKDFLEIHDKKIKIWVMGHAHPAVNLSDGTKIEKYKCFLIGNWKGRKIIIVPSFFPVVEGSNVFGLNGKDVGLAWDFKLSKFDVKIVEGQESLKVLNFGKLDELEF